jgi:glycosyltransferase involved in cell wall biosynthesis
VLAEALACGVPVVTGTGGALTEVGESAALYIDPQDPLSIAVGIRKALNSDTLAQLVRAGFEQLEVLRSGGGRFAQTAAASIRGCDR